MPTEPTQWPTRRQALAVLAAAPAAIRAATLSSTPTDWTLQQASEQIRARKLSPVELTRACLTLIEKLNPKVNAFITVMTEQAMAQARELEAQQHAGKMRGPLHGIPIGLKDLYDTADAKTTCASAVFANRVPTEDAEVVRRLKAAGAIIVGKQNMHEFAYGATSVPSHFGAVHNPWNPDRIAGGSSGGSAVSVATSMCFAALGSDTGGSIRCPSAYCGITGLKPTYGRVSTRGVVPLSWSLDHAGPMSRTAEDAALILAAIAGYDPKEPTSVDWPVDNYVQGLRAKTVAWKIGTPRRMFFEQLDPEIQAAVSTALDVIDKLTAGVRDVELPAYQPLPVVGVEAHTFHKPYLTKTPELYQASTRRRLEGNANVPASGYVEGRRELDRLRRVIGDVFTNVDLLVAPTTPIQPWTIAEASKREELTTPPTGVNGAFAPLRNTSPFDVFGIPAISIPCGFSRDGMPIGLQIAGPRFAEGRVLALARAYQQATDWHLRRPTVS